MFRFIIIVSLLAGALASLEVLQQCIDTNTNSISNGYMTGTWHYVYKFTLFGGMVPSRQCNNITFTIPTAEQLRTYKDRYDGAGFPFTLDGTSLHAEENKDSGYLTRPIGMYTRGTEAKYYVLDPDSKMVLNMYGYDVSVYQRIDNNYMLYWQCSSRGFVRWLLSRKADAPLEEMLAIIKDHPVLKNLQSQRFCAA